ncbi:UDP-N-acetylglucosamine 2-epimerase [Ligilactobacillus ceti DSM 22408]|uniref:UDP-N-acetylglucosamine 2-epimerase (non-hydrolyzing) n=2 Tax=Ligilactobacillus TaxID=2767887 RepID=A0A0R2KLX6_9LACO|nr:UDP-N-acetylglucosamine 2-epimerase [Ligilactobacillus ceti DSM 22408]
MTVFGTRPEAIKMVPLVLALQNDDRFQAITVVTGQHREMLDQVLEIFDVKPDHDLDIMHQNQTLTDITALILEKLDQVLKEEQPDIVLVHGDTTTTFATSLSAFYNQIPIGHVEAGLRTWNRYSPFPEEMNRQMTDVLSTLYFAPTPQSKANLLKENRPEKDIFITGNTAIDTLMDTIKKPYQLDCLANVKPEHKMILVTMHRRENLGAAMEEVFQALLEVVQEKDDVEIVYPMHLNPKVREVARKILGNHPRVHLIEPLDVTGFHHLLNESYFIMTDSGGIQEEAPSLGKPVLVLRDTTERPEGIAAQTLKLVGTQSANVKKTMLTLLEDQELYQTMSQASNPYGDGHASQRILDDIAYYFDQTLSRPADFEI